MARAATKRLHQHRGAAHGRQGLEQAAALRGKFFDASRQRERDRNRHGEWLDALGLPIGELAVNGFEIVEVMEHEPQRDASAFGDTRSSRTEIAFIEEVEKSVHHGMARASGAGEASIEGG